MNNTICEVNTETVSNLQKAGQAAVDALTNLTGAIEAVTDLEADTPRSRWWRKQVNEATIAAALLTDRLTHLPKV